MKVEKIKQAFEPVVITLETEEELFMFKETLAITEKIEIGFQVRLSPYKRLLSFVMTMQEKLND